MGEQIISSLLIKTRAVSFFLLKLSFVYNQAFYFNMGKKEMKTYIVLLCMFLLLQETS